MKKNIFQKTFKAGVIKALNLVLSLILYSVLARSLGAEQFGIYSLIIAFLSLLMIPAQLGLPNLITRETALIQSKKDWSLLRGVWIWSISISILSSIILFTITTLILEETNGISVKLNNHVLYLGMPTIVLVTLTTIISAISRGLGRVFDALFPQMIFLPIVFIILLIANSYNTPGNATAEAAMVFHGISALISLIAGIFFIAFSCPAEIWKSKRISFLNKTWSKSAITLGLTAGAGVIMRYTDTLMLGIMRTETEVGNYRMAAQWSLVLSVGIVIVNYIVPSLFIDLYTKKNNFEIQKLANKATYISLIFSVPSFLFFIIFGDKFIIMTAGKQFESAYFPLIILSVGQLFYATWGANGIMLSMAHFEKEALQVMIYSSLLNVALNIFFIPEYGIIGASVSTAVSFLLLGVLSTIFIHRKIGIKTGFLHFRGNK
jgi:O-antigen/teichoic acid export membrane protein